MARPPPHWHRRTANVVAGCATVFGSAAFAANLAVTVDNIERNEGVLRIAVYEQPHWLDEDPANVAASEVYDLAGRKADGAVVVNFDLKPGEYGAVVYHDVNDNHELDKNFVGIPKEPYGFSMGFSKLRRPKFEDCRFEVGEDGAVITLTLRD